MNDFQMYEEGRKEAENKQCNISVVRLRSIFSTMKVSNYETDNKILSNLEWFYRNLHVHNRRHKDYIEAIDIIETMLNEA